jgi:hypothetical protein
VHYGNSWRFHRGYWNAHPHGPARIHHRDRYDRAYDRGYRNGYRHGDHRGHGNRSRRGGRGH